jgi:hypothetical protein
LSDPRILLLGPALDEAESAVSLERLRHVMLPNINKFVVTTGKFDTQKSAKTFNAEAGAEYPSETAYLQTLAAWAEVSNPRGPRFRDGYDLFCLRSILARNAPVDHAILLRDPILIQERWRELRDGVDGKLFLTFDEPSSERDGAADNVLFNLADPRATAFLDLLWDLFAGGAVYGMAPYSLDLALSTAAEALHIQDKIYNGGHRTGLVSSDVR